jgi:hypothetical protein
MASSWELRLRLERFLPQLRALATPEQLAKTDEFLVNNELGLALDALTDMILEQQLPLTRKMLDALVEMSRLAGQDIGAPLLERLVRE